MTGLQTGSRKRLITWRGVLLALTLAALMGLSADWQRFQESTYLVEHTYKVLVAAEELRTSIAVAETSQRDYLLAGEGRYLAAYNAVLPDIDGNQKRVRELTGDNPGLQARMAALDRAFAEELSELRETIELRRKRQLEQAMLTVRMERSKNAIAEIRRITEYLRQEEYPLLTERSAAARVQITRTRRLGVLGVCFLIALLVLTTVSKDRDATRRRRSEEALRISEEQFRQVFEESPSGILLIEEDLRIRRGNPALCRLLGYQDEEIRSLTLPAIIPSGSLGESVQCQVGRPLITKSGGEVWVNLNATAIRVPAARRSTIWLSSRTPCKGRRPTRRFANSTTRSSFACSSAPTSWCA